MEDFEGKIAADYGIEPYHLVSQPSFVKFRGPQPFTFN